MTPPQATGRRTLPVLVCGAALLLFAALKLYSTRYGAGDENMYFYMATRAAEGVLPYRDFVFAHPPLHLLPAAGLFWLIDGFHFGAGRLLPALATAVAGVFLFRLSGRHGPAQGAIACILFLLCYDVLRASTHFSGANLAAMWTAIALERLSTGRERTAAVAFALGTLTAVYVAPSGAGAALALLLTDRRRALRFIAAGLLVFGFVNLVCFAAFGAGFIQHVYLHHFGGPPENMVVDGAFPLALRAAFAREPLLLWGAVVGAVALAMELDASVASGGAGAVGPGGARRAALQRFSREHFDLLVVGCAALMNLAFLTSRSRIMVYYFMPLFVCAAPLAAHGLTSLARGLALAARRRDRRVLLSMAALVGVLVAGEALRQAAVRAEARDQRGAAATRYPWHGSGIPLLDRVVRPLLWRDQPIEGRWTPPLTQYLWHESQWFESAEDLAQEVRSRTAESDTIFGDSTSTPLIALLADRRIALDEADTNVMGFLKRPESGAELIRRLDRAPPRVVIARGDFGIYGMRFFRSWVSRNYEVALEWRDPGFGTYLLLTPRAERVSGDAGRPARPLRSTSVPPQSHAGDLIREQPHRPQQRAPQEAQQRRLRQVPDHQVVDELR
jgi:hypothetical protein